MKPMTESHEKRFERHGQWRWLTWRVPVLLSLACCVLAVLAQQARANEDVELGIQTTCRNPITGNRAMFSTAEIRILNRANVTRVCEIRINNRTWRHPDLDVRKRVTLAPGKNEVTLVIPKLVDEFELSFVIDGSLRQDLNESFGWYSSDLPVINIGDVDGKVIAVCQTTSSSGGSWSSSTNVSRVEIPDPRDCTESWQCYLGMHGVVVVQADAVGKMTSSARTALRRWVVYGGGTLWVWGDEAATALKRLQLLPSGNASGKTVSTVSGEVAGDAATTEQAPSTLPSQYDKGYGRVRVLLTLQQSRFEQSAVRSDLTSFAQKHSEFQGDNELFSDLHTIPSMGYAGVTLALALVIGPLNLLVLRRKKKVAWFYVTAPVLAMAGMVALVTVSVLNDGLGVKMNEQAVLVHEPGLNEGMMYHSRGFYAGMAPGSGLHYDPDTAVYPFLHENDDSDMVSYAMDMTKDQHLTDGWLASRHYRGLYTMSPQTVRMGIHVGDVKDGKVTLRNDLPFAVRGTSVCVMDQGLKRYLSHNESIAPGQNVTLALSDSAFSPKGGKYPINVPADWQVIARAEGLPYLDTGGVSALALEARYYYVALAP